MLHEKSVKRSFSSVGESFVRKKIFFIRKKMNVSSDVREFGFESILDLLLKIRVKGVFGGQFLSWSIIFER